jgi:hypothetical protein
MEAEGRVARLEAELHALKAMLLNQRGALNQQGALN